MIAFTSFGSFASTARDASPTRSITNINGTYSSWIFLPSSKSACTCAASRPSGSTSPGNCLLVIHGEFFAECPQVVRAEAGLVLEDEARGSPSPAPATAPRNSGRAQPPERPTHAEESGSRGRSTARHWPRAASARSGWARLQSGHCRSSNTTIARSTPSGSLSCDPSAAPNAGVHRPTRQVATSSADLRIFMRGSFRDGARARWIRRAGYSDRVLAERAWLCESGAGKYGIPFVPAGLDAQATVRARPLAAARRRLANSAARAPSGPCSTTSCSPACTSNERDAYRSRSTTSVVARPSRTQWKRCCCPTRWYTPRSEPAPILAVKSTLPRLAGIRRPEQHAPLVERRPHAEEVLVPGAKVLGVGPGLQVRAGEPRLRLTGMRVRVQCLGQSADHSALQRHSIPRTEQLPRRLNLLEANQLVDEDAIEPRPDRAVVIRLVLVPAARGQVIRMKEPVAGVQRRDAPRKHQRAPGLCSDCGRIGLGQQVEREQHVRPQRVVRNARAQ